MYCHTYQMHPETSDKFTRACIKAQEESAKHGCTQHVNAQVCIHSFPDDEKMTVVFVVSDWYADGSTVRTYNNGKQS